MRLGEPGRSASRRGDAIGSLPGPAQACHFAGRRDALLPERASTPAGKEMFTLISVQSPSSDPELGSAKPLAKLS